MSAQQSPSSSSVKFVWVGVAVVFVAIVWFWNSSQMAAQSSRPMPGGQPGGAPTASSGPASSGAATGQPAGKPSGSKPATNTDAANIRVVEATAGQYQAQLSGYGAASARFELTLTAKVSGVVESLAADFESGTLVKRNQLLAQLEDSDYRSAVATARQNLADAKVTLLEEQREYQQAAADWQAAGLDGEPDSPLLLRKPQLEAAEAALATAQASLTAANKDLQSTRITAPFDALVVNRSLIPGGYVSTGGEVASLYSTDRIEIPVAFSEREWLMLPDGLTLQKQRWPVQIRAVESGYQWQGYVNRVEQHLDTDTRQRSLIVALDKPFEQQPILPPGTFVEISLQGKQVDQVWKLPASALSQRGDIWFVGDNKQLARRAASVLFSDASSIYVQVPAGLTGKQLVVMQPLSSYAEGSLVEPKVVEAGASGLTQDDQQHSGEAGYE
ncbi:efflux RND transporter periplasmic adaptor subunit [Oceanobacter mangrovi]|uniref:efflux RND transporter periplasmic adaptor subunit n=1 Tax=Oceanobacter mangrovi TaxID=2862510 RepID=UPI001C8E5ADF|nr:efflux RND transporter periplasmic adaptor subunit [Oceanobacter mangrovi]